MQILGKVIVGAVLACSVHAAVARAPTNEAVSADMVREVQRRLNGTLLSERHALEESRRTIAALRVYAATGEQHFFSDALRRARHLAAWNPRGRTDEDSRSVAWALALAYDWLGPRLDNTQKTQLLAPLRERTNELINVVSPDGRPTLLAIATLLAGDVPESKLWLVKLGREAS